MHPADELVLFRTNPTDRSESRRLQRARSAGTLVRVRHGVFAERAAWQALDGRGRHLVQVRAALPDLPRGAVLSHDSAAALHGVPRLDRWPQRVHATVPDAVGDAHRVGLTLHAGRVRSDRRRYQGLPIADLADTVVALARRSDLSGAVVALDHAVRRGVTVTDLAALLDDGPRWGAARATEALAVCDAAHESVGESYAAARFHELGITGVVAQHEFARPDGRPDRVDFWLPSLGVVIEFDGRQKYQDREMLAGRSGADVLWAEKLREDRIRARPEVRGFVRVTWWHLVDPERLRALFRAHGLHW